MSTAAQSQSDPSHDVGPLRDHVALTHFQLAWGVTLATGSALVAQWLALTHDLGGNIVLSPLGETLYGPPGPLALAAMVLVTAYLMRRAVGHSGPVASMLLYASFCVTLGIALVAPVGNECARSVSRALSVASLAFCAMAAYGLLTGRLLSGLGSLALTGLLGLGCVWLLGEMAPYPGAVSAKVSIAFAVAFAAYVAYDTQRLRRFCGTGDDTGQASVWGAMSFFSDMLRLPMDLLRALGRVNWWQAICEFLGYLIAAVIFGMLGN